MSDTCTVTISGPGKPVSAELPTNEAESISELAGLLAGAPRRPGELSAESIARRSKRHEEALQGGRSILSQLGMLAELGDLQITLVLQYVRLLRFGYRGLGSEEDNWILEVINGLLWECVRVGTGEALANGPGDMLRDLAHSYCGFRTSIDRAREAANEYTPLFEDTSANSTSESLLALRKAVGEQEAPINALPQTVRRAVVAKAKKAK